MKELINKAFPHCEKNGCLEDVVLEKLFIYDDAACFKSCIYKDSEPLPYPFFTINNPAKKEIHFLAIDHCLLFDCDGAKCDFAAFDEKSFYFVEIKKGLGSAENRSNKKLSAIGQLRTTLKLFTDSIDFKGYRLMACICVGYESPSPAAPASDLDLLVEFINDYNTELFEGNEVNF